MAEETYLAEVVRLGDKTGTGGSIRICQLQLQTNKRILQRAIIGPVREGDILELMECEREVRSRRF